MAVQLILKNSSVEDRHPTANQLINGEIALNYNEAGAFLSCRDTNGDIQQIGGVKIDDATPGSPSKQALWFQPSTSKLFIYDGTGWLVVASGGGGGPGSDTVDQILAGNGINADPSTGLGTITLDADLNFSRGLEFVAGQIAIALGVGLEFDVNGKLANPNGPVQYRGTLDLTSSDPTPTNPVQGDTWVNTADGTSDAVWNPDIPTGTTVEVGDLVIYDGTIWTFLARGLSPAERTDLGLGVVDAVSVEVTSSTGSNVQLPAATSTTAGVLTAADKAIIDEGASTWERNGSTLQPVSNTYDVEIGGGNIELNADGRIQGANFIQARQGFIAKQDSNYFFVGQSTSNVNSFMVRSSGTVLIGGTLPSAPSIELTTNGVAKVSGGFVAKQDSGYFFAGQSTSNVNSFLVDSSGNVLIGGTLPSAPNISLKADGSSIFKGKTHEFGSIGSAGPQYISVTSGGAGTAGFFGYGLRDRPGIFSSTSSPKNTNLCIGTGGVLSLKSGADSWSSVGATVALFDDSGTLSLGGTLPASPNIQLNADGSATFTGSVSIGGTAAANTIDEYEEGTWTPTIVDNGGAAQTAFTATNGTYTRIGNVVTCYVQLSYDTTGTIATSTFRLPLPFANANGSCTFIQTSALTDDGISGFSQSASYMRCSIPTDVPSGTRDYRGLFTYIVG